MTFERHPFCELFPDLPADELEELANDIRDNGQSTPIVRWNGKILDGKNRLTACGMAGVEPVFTDWSPRIAENGREEALAYCVSLNINRRQLSGSQRAMIAAGIANLRKGWQNDNPPIGGIGQSDAAEQAGASVRSTQRAKAILDDGAKSLVKAVTNGDVTVSDAASIIDLPKNQQAQAVKAVKAGVTSTVAEAARKPKTVSEMLAEKRAKNQPTEETIALDESLESCSSTVKRLEKQLKSVREALAVKSKSTTKMATVTKGLEKKIDFVDESLAELSERLEKLVTSWQGSRKQVDDLA